RAIGRSPTAAAAAGELGTLTPARPVPILPRSGLYLEPVGHGDQARFAGLFAQTWRGLPHYARRTMLRYWRGPLPARWSLLGLPLLGVRTYPVRVPRIQLLRGWGSPSTGVVL